MVKNMMKILMSNTFWQAIAAIGTVLAVIVSLYLANRKEKPYRKLEVGKTVTYLYEKGDIVLTVTLDNIGNRPIAIQECGMITKNCIDTTYNKYLVLPFKPQVIEVGKVLILEYKYNFGRSFNDEDIKKDRVNINFSKEKFGVRDSRNIIHI